MRNISYILTTFAIALPAQADTISIGVPNWFAGEIIGDILHEIIETEFGVEADSVAGENAEIFGGMAAGDGSFDIHTDSWLPLQNDWIEPAVAAGTIAKSGVTYGGLVGFCAPRYTVEKLGISEMKDLAKPSVVAALDSDQDGSIPIWVGGSGWAMSAAGEVKLRDYGLSGNYTPEVTSEGDFEKKLMTAFSSREDVVFACYGPHSWFATEFIDVLKEPVHRVDGYKLVLPSDSESWLQESRIVTGDAPAIVQITYSTRLERDHPEIAAFLSRFGMSNDDITELLFLAQVKGIDSDFVVQDWIKANQDRIAAAISG